MNVETNNLDIQTIPNSIKKLEKKINLLIDKQIERKVFDYSLHHKTKLDTLRKKIKSGSKVKVFFLISDMSKFPASSVYKSMLKYELFDPYLYVIARHNISIDSAKEEYEFFKEQGYNVIFARDSNGNYISLENYKPDIVFCNQPALLKGHFRWDLLSYQYLTCYIPYSCGVVATDRYHILHEYMNLSWLIFLSNHFIWERSQEIGYASSKYLSFGYPKMDDYIKPKEDIKTIEKFNNGNPIVVYAPHWNIDKNLNLSTFHLYSSFFIELLEQYPEINFVFKPHPELPYQIRALEKKGSKITMTYNEYHDYIKKWSEFSNGIYINEGEYFDLFMSASCLITDCGSFVGEWLPSGHPCIYLFNPINEEPMKNFRPFAQRILESYYICNTQEEIRTTFIDVVIKGNDLKKENRKILSKALFPELGLAGEKIVKYLYNQLVE